MKWIRVVEAAAPHGLAPLSGSITDVGVVGYTTGGGLGPMARTYGLASDKVRAIEVVTGDGVLRRVTPTEHPDLFFALRGGKGMLGIVTAVEFDLVRQPTFYGGAVWFDGDDAATVIERWLHWSEELPELGTTSFALFQLPAMPGVPPELAGRMTLGGPLRLDRRPRRGGAAVRRDPRVRAGPARRRGAEAVHRHRLGAHRPARPDAGVRGGGGAHRVPDRGRRRLPRADRARSGSPQVLVELRQLGGAFTRGGEHESAFSSRDAAWSLLIVGIADVPGVESHAETILEAMEPWTGGHRLPNFTFAPEEYVDAYDEAALARLRAAIRTYDPYGVMAIGRTVMDYPGAAPPTKPSARGEGLSTGVDLVCDRPPRRETPPTPRLRRD